MKKGSKRNILSKTLMAGVLASILSCGIAIPVNAAGWIHAAPPLRQDDAALLEWGVITVNSASIETDGVHDPYNITVYKNLKTGTYRFIKEATGSDYFREDSELNNAEVMKAFNASSMQQVYDMLNGDSGSSNSITGLSVNGKTITYTKADGTTGTITTQDNDTKYSAGQGVTLSGTTFSARAGTNVTVNSSGINVTGNCTVASGNTGLIDGGKLYSEVRPSDNGNYVIFLSPFPEFFL